MFCSNCGKEVPNEARFCLHCGTGLQARTEPKAVTPRAPAIGTTLTDYHVRDWQGECPACHLVHTAENCSCPNDGSPVVVAFRKHKKPKASFYPLHSATLCCLNDCGMGTNAFPCSGCGALITGRYITFRFPESHVRSHERTHNINFVIIIISLLVFGWTAFVTYKGFSQGDANIEIVWGLSAELLWGWSLLASMIAFVFFGISYNSLRRYRSKKVFDFTDVADEAKSFAKEVAIEDAVRTAKATAAATKPFKLGVD